MRKENYYVYCQGILGVKTDIPNFKWVYGSAAPPAAAEEYEACVVKFDLRVLPERELDSCLAYDKRFQAYAWDDREKTIYYRRTLLSKLEVGYNIRICGSRVEAYIGERYFKFIKNRVMNLHGVYYLLSDVANMLLLHRGYLTLYASAVSYEEGKRGLVFFAPPNTGKTVTAVRLCENCNCSLIGEDVVITDGVKIYGCPWTSSYRKQSISVDSAGVFGRAGQPKNIYTAAQSKITDLFVLALGKQKAGEEKREALRQIKILNGYLFQYFSSPIIKVLGFFDGTYAVAWSNRAEALLEQMVKNCDCRTLQEEYALDFWKTVQRSVSGEII